MPQQFEIGQTLPGLEIAPVSLETVRAFAAIQRDDNPIHVSEAAARAAGFAAPIVHGAYIYCQFERLILAWGQGRMLSLQCRFVRPLLVGSALRITGRIVAADSATVTLRLLAEDDAGQPLAIGDGRVGLDGNSFSGTD